MNYNSISVDDNQAKKVHVPYVLPYFNATVICKCCYRDIYERTMDAMVAC